MRPHSPSSPRKLQNSELRCSSKKLRKRQNLLEGRRPCRRSASSNLPGCSTAPQLLGKDIAITLPTLPHHNPKQPGPAVSRHWAGVAVFLLYLAELGGEWVMFAQRSVHPHGYVRPRGYSGGSAGCASRAHARGCRAARRRARGQPRTGPRSGEFGHRPGSSRRCTACAGLPRCPVLSGCMPGGRWPRHALGQRCPNAAAAVFTLHGLPTRRCSAAKTPAPAPVTQLLKVAGWRPGSRSICLLLLLIVLIST